MKIGIIIGIIIVFIILIVIVAGAMGYINLGAFFNAFGLNNDDPSNPEDANVTGTFTNLQLSDREIHAVICFMSNRSPPFNLHQNFINGLHMTVYGANDLTAYEVLLDYEEYYRDEDFLSYTTGVQRGTGWTAYSEIWYNDVGMGRAVITGDGSSVHSLYGYDMTLLTSYGPILDYYDYVTFLNRY